MNSSSTIITRAMIAFAVSSMLALTSCAQVDSPGARSASIPAVTPPLDRYKGVNEERDAITEVRLGRDVLVPQRPEQDALPEDYIGPFELRGETLASALQVILDDYDISLAFESDSAMTARISVTNLRGTVGEVVQKVCSLANLYCHYKDGLMTVKDTETFVVDLPPILGTSDATSSNTSSSNNSDNQDSNTPFDQIASGLEALVGNTPTVDETTRVMIYSATHRTQRYAEQYFERLRKNTALIIYETHIWEVSLDNNNRTGIDWSVLARSGNFGLDIVLPGGAPDGTAAPISITPSYTGSNGITPSTVLEFISEHGTVKTVSQPQIAVLSGATASLSVQQSENFVSGVARTPSTTSGVADTVSTTTGTVQTGLSMTVSSAWDQATVYGTIEIDINDLLSLDSFNPDTNTTIQLPRTTQRGLQTQVRVRPGDAILIGGLVTQRDNYNSSGPGFMKPLFSSAREASTRNTELVFLLRPRIVAFISGDEGDTQPVAESVRHDFPMHDMSENIGRLFATTEEETKPIAAAQSGEDIAPEQVQAEAPVAVDPVIEVPPPSLPVQEMDMIPIPLNGQDEQEKAKEEEMKE